MKQPAAGTTRLSREAAPRRGNITAGRRSLRTQLIAWNIAALTLVFALFGGVIRYTARSFMLTAVDRELRARVARAMGPPPPGERRERLEAREGPGRPPRPPRPNDPQEPGAENDATRRNDDGADNARADNPDGAAFLSGPRPDAPGNAARSPIPSGLPPPENIPYRPQRYTLAGQPFEGGEGHAVWDRAAFATAASGGALYSTVTVEGEPFRVLSRSFPPDSPPDGVIQAAYPLAEVNTAISGLDRGLLMLIPIALLCAGLAGAGLTNRVLRRVRSMADAAEQIGARDLSERLPVMGSDEFSSLAETFNGLLGRVETTFQEQERALEQQRRFTADASHELKTPLTVIRGNASMALNGPEDVALYRHSLQDIDRSAQIMAHLVQDLLLLARSDGGQLGQKRIEILAREVLESARAGVSTGEHAPITLNVEDAALSILGNESELTRLFSNLLDNAIQYTPFTGKITVTARRRGAAVEVQVEDTGAGIAPEHLVHLGERFYRVDASRTRPTGGTGLGLSICKGIAEAHGGSLAFASAPGIGTRVTVTLPTVNMENPAYLPGS